MLRGMSSRQFMEWMAYFDLEHLGRGPEERADVRAAGIQATAVNIAKNGKGSPAKVGDFMPVFTKPDPEAAQRALLASMSAQAAADAKKAKPKPKVSNGGSQ
jgi:hypothetical protein